MNPAPTRDLTIQQRGRELLLSFSYPQTTVSGLPLPELSRVEFWGLERAVPESAFEVNPELEEALAAAQAEEDVDGERPVGETGLVEEEVLEEETSAVDDDSEDFSEPEPRTRRGRGMVRQTPEAMARPTRLPTKEEMVAVDPLEFGSTAQIKVALEGEELSGAIAGDRIYLRLPMSKAAGEDVPVYYFAVKTFNGPRLASSLSNQVTLVRRQAPEPPVEVGVTAEAAGVRVKWKNELAAARAQMLEERESLEPGTVMEPPQEILEGPVGYRVYRRDAQSRNYIGHLAELNRFESEYLDNTAQYGNKYIYAVTAIGERNPMVESPLSGEFEVSFEDRFAPPPPANPIALPEAGRIRILWDASPASDLAGYLVFRRQPGGEFVQLNREPTLDLEYDDRTVTAGRTYEYRIAAVDRLGNEGEPGAIVKAQAP